MPPTRPVISRIPRIVSPTIVGADVLLSRLSALPDGAIGAIVEPEHVLVDQPPLSRSGLAFISVHSGGGLAVEVLRAQALDAEATVLRAVDVPLTAAQLDAVVAFAHRVGPQAFRDSTLLRHLGARRLDLVQQELSDAESDLFGAGRYGDVPDEEEIDFDREIPLAKVGDVETVLDGVAIVRSGPPDFASQGTTLPKWDRVRIDEVSADELFVRVSTPAGVARGWTLRSNLGGYFRNEPSVASVPLAPSTPIEIDAGWSGNKKALARAYNRLGNLMRALTKVTGVSLPAVLAVWKIESSGAAHEPGQAIIRFENHLFYNRWGKDNLATFDAHFQFGTHAGIDGKAWENHRWRPSAAESWRTFHGTQAKEYEVLAFARSLADAPGLRSISIGGPQILVSHSRMIGYESPLGMLDAFQADERFHVLGFFDYCQYAAGHLDRRRELLRHMRALRWVDFARGYNGKGQAQSYGNALAEAYAEAQTLPLDESAPTEAAPQPGGSETGSDPGASGDSSSPASVPTSPLLGAVTPLARLRLPPGIRLGRGRGG